jgi:hypothetical protein
MKQAGLFGIKQDPMARRAQGTRFLAPNKFG